MANQYEVQELQEKKRILKWSTLLVITLLIVVVLFMMGCPSYNVYKQRKEGEAQLAHAQSSKEVAVAEARAKMESATMLAQADTIRARGVAISNQIIGASLEQNEAYLKWLWIDNLENNPNAVIYVPTEANIPIMESRRLPLASNEK